MIRRRPDATVARAIEDLKRAGYVQVRPIPSPTLREAFLKEVMIRASVMGMTADDVAVGILSLAGVHPAVAKADTEVLLVECSQQELDYFARELQAYQPGPTPAGDPGGCGLRPSRNCPHTGTLDRKRRLATHQVPGHLPR